MKIPKTALVGLAIISWSMLLPAGTVNAGSSGKTPITADTCGVNKSGPGIKAEAGINNILFGWTEIPSSIIETTRSSKNPFWGLVAGTFIGIGKAFPRTVSGISDLAMLPAANCDETPINADKLNTQIR